MSNISQFFGSGGKLRYQEFTSSGTFTPNEKLLANGGQVWVLLVGAGQAGQNGSASFNGRGGNGGSVLVQPFVVAGPVTVSIGAGGAANLANGGNSSFGGLVALGGATDVSRIGGGAGGAGSYPQGQSGAYGFGGGGSGAAGSTQVQGACGGGKAPGGAGASNSGGGGGGGSVDQSASGAGGSGFCRVWWYE